MSKRNTYGTISLIFAMLIFFSSGVIRAVPPSPPDLRASSIKADEADLTLEYSRSTPSALSAHTLKNMPSDLSLVFSELSPTALNGSNLQSGETVDLRYSPVSRPYMNATSISEDKSDLDLVYSLVAKAYLIMTSQLPAAPNLNLLLNKGTRTYLSSRFMRPQSSAINSRGLSKDIADLDL